MNLYTGKTALVTGVSAGIGAAFARGCAQRGMHLILVARSENTLRALADSLQQQHGVKVEVIVADLGQEHAAKQVYAAVQERGLRVDMLINNAGISTNGAFDTISADKSHQQVMLNVTALVDLTHAFLPAMVAARAGAIINVASTAAFFPIAQQAVYGASKAFVLSFSEALWAENRSRGVRVLALCPGATDTEFFAAMGRDTTAPKQSAQSVVEVGLTALERGRNYVIPGAGNFFQGAVLPRLLPRAIIARLVARVVKNFWQPVKA